MSKKKGLSNEEKREKMLEIFHEQKEFYQLKDIERIAPKEKGIILQSVKPVLQNLVGDGLVDSDKIGTSIYYWAYPDKLRHIKRKLRDDLVQQNTEATKKLQLLENALAEEKKARTVSTSRSILIKELDELRKEEKALTQELQQFEKQNPEQVHKMKAEIPIILEAANRWTDNVFTIKSWCKNKFNIEDKEIDKQFRIPDDFDYLE